MKRKEPDSSTCNKPQPKKGHWAQGLLRTMKSPEFVVKTDEKITIIKDMYPKAKHHFLVLPHEEISSLKSVTKNHLLLLKHMEKIAKEYVQTEHPTSQFKYGYHAEASMERLHLHVISDDMDSPALKTKRHWNSFNTDFFLRSSNVIKDLENNGKIAFPSKETCKEYLVTPLKCHKCDFKPKNIPELKKHIVSHFN